MIKKAIEPTGDVCVKFTQDELIELNINEGDKFSIKECDDGILLQKFEKIELDISEWDRSVLEMLIIDSCEKDISINEIIIDIISKFIKNQNTH
jgi:hypothetical protein